MTRLSIKGIPVGDENFGALCICAIRYCLGRQTYMPSLIINYLTPLLPGIEKGSLLVMKKDIEDAESWGWGDSVIDNPTWKKFLNDIEKELRRNEN